MLKEVTKQNTNQDEYNGWSNRETWLANLWLTNDEYSNSFLLSFCKQDEGISARADRLKSYMRYEMLDKLDDSSLWTDLLNTAFHRIDWIEIIEAHQEM